MARPKKTDQEIEAMRERILDATLALIQEGGSIEASIRKIADRVGMSPMALYGYFENRSAIIAALRERAFGRMQAICSQSLRRAENGDSLAQVRASLALFIRLSREHPVLYQLTWRRASADSSTRVDSRNVAQLLDHLSRLIQLCIERGQCVERDPSLAAVTVFSMVNGTLVLHHNVSAIAETERQLLEREIVEAAMTYLTGQGGAGAVEGPEDARPALPSELS